MKSVLTLAFIVFCSVAFSQYEVTFVLADSLTEKPIENATLYLKNKTYNSNEAGEVVVFVPEGKYNYTVFYPGYKPLSNTAYVAGNKTILLKLNRLNEKLNTYTVTDTRQTYGGMANLRAVEDFGIYAAKKNEVILPAEQNANLATNNARQIYSKVPGITVWENDRSGIQLNIAARGLNPGRTANFNTRQNGYDIAADALGYPEAYYTPPAEAIERIEVVRGAASLQFGPQFGGMINFKLKNAPTARKFGVESRQTVGSFRLLNSFNSVGGTHNKWSYLAMYNRKQGEGWRPNTHFEQDFGYLKTSFMPSQRLSISAEYTGMQYLAQQAGGLTEQQFEDDPYQSNRARNWFRVKWQLASIQATYKISNRLKLNNRLFGLIGSRESLGFLSYINRKDPGAERNYFYDEYLNWGNETRLLYNYELGSKTAVLLAGVRVYQGNTMREQGFGDSESGPNFAFDESGDFGFSRYRFPSSNLSFFAENILFLSEKLSITPGVRLEHIRTQADGEYSLVNKDLAGNVLFADTFSEKLSNARLFPLFGLGIAYKLSKSQELYANFSQNYRAVNFNDIRSVNGNLDVDPDIQDESGFTADIGIRAPENQIFRYDFTAFAVYYSNRIGLIWREGNPRPLRTNVADALNLGVESFMSLDFAKLFNAPNHWSYSVFTNLAVIEASYLSAQEQSLEGNRVELVPLINFKTGAELRYKNTSIALLFTHVSEQFTDATNAISTPNAVSGLIPDYQVLDVSCKQQIKNFSLEFGVNNLLNEIYFTQRADGYPGPGIIPADIRNFYFTLGYKLW